MLVVGLTGGIGSGKSTVADYFRALNTPVICADAHAHALLQPPSTHLKKVIEHFGTTCLTPDGQLNRQQLANIIFTDPKQKQWLEHTLHPLILEAMQADIASLNAPYCVIDIPLLAETGPYAFIDRVLVVDCPPKLQIERVTHRDNRSLTQIKAMLNQQVSRQQRLSIAHDIIDNSSDLESLKSQVKTLHQTYMSGGFLK